MEKNGCLKYRKRDDFCLLRKTCMLLTLFLLICFICPSCAESITRMHYVFLDWAGEYSGQVDSNSIPFGYGLFESSTALEGEKWHYIGFWENGVPQGEGAIYFENGNMQKGTFCNGVLIEGLMYTVTGLAATPVKIERVAVENDTQYIGNKKSMRFHYPSCNSVTQMKEKNKVEFSSREEAIDSGYIPCGDCHP